MLQNKKINLPTFFDNNLCTEKYKIKDKDKREKTKEERKKKEFREHPEAICECLSPQNCTLS